MPRRTTCVVSAEYDETAAGAPSPPDAAIVPKKLTIVAAKSRLIALGNRRVSAAEQFGDLAAKAGEDVRAVDFVVGGQ